MKPIPQSRTLANQLSRAFIFFGTLVAAAFFVTVLMYGVNWAWLTPELEQSRLGVRTESVAYAAMLDEETALRAYLLTRDVRFLEPPAGRSRSLEPTRPSPHTSVPSLALP